MPFWRPRREMQQPFSLRRALDLEGASFFGLECWVLPGKQGVVQPLCTPVRTELED